MKLKDIPMETIASEIIGSPMIEKIILMDPLSDDDDIVLNSESEASDTESENSDTEVDSEMDEESSEQENNRPCFKLEDIVTVAGRNVPGEKFREQAVGRITAVNGDGTYAINFFVAGFKEKSVKECELTLNDESALVVREQKFRCVVEWCICFPVDCGHDQSEESVAALNALNPFKTALKKPRETVASAEEGEEEVEEVPVVKAFKRSVARKRAVDDKENKPARASKRSKHQEDNRAADDSVRETGREKVPATAVVAIRSPAPASVTDDGEDEVECLLDAIRAIETPAYSRQVPVEADALYAPEQQDVFDGRTVLADRFPDFPKPSTKQITKLVDLVGAESTFIMAEGGNIPPEYKPFLHYTKELDLDKVIYLLTQIYNKCVELGPHFGNFKALISNIDFRRNELESSVLANYLLDLEDGLLLAGAKLEFLKMTYDSAYKRCRNQCSKIARKKLKAFDSRFSEIYHRLSQQKETKDKLDKLYGQFEKEFRITAMQAAVSGADHTSEKSDVESDSQENGQAAYGLDEDSHEEEADDRPFRAALAYHDHSGARSSRVHGDVWPVSSSSSIPIKRSAPRPALDTTNCYKRSRHERSRDRGTSSHRDARSASSGQHRRHEGDIGRGTSSGRTSGGQSTGDHLNTAAFPEELPLNIPQPASKIKLSLRTDVASTAKSMLSKFVDFNQNFPFAALAAKYRTDNIGHLRNASFDDIISTLRLKCVAVESTEVNRWVIEKVILLVVRRNLDDDSQLKESAQLLVALWEDPLVMDSPEMALYCLIEMRQIDQFLDMRLRGSQPLHSVEFLKFLEAICQLVHNYSMKDNREHAEKFNHWKKSMQSKLLAIDLRVLAEVTRSILQDKHTEDSELYLRLLILTTPYCHDSFSVKLRHDTNWAHVNCLLRTKHARFDESHNTAWLVLSLHTFLLLVVSTNGDHATRVSENWAFLKTTIPSALHENGRYLDLVCMLASAWDDPTTGYECFFHSEVKASTGDIGGISEVTAEFFKLIERVVFERTSPISLADSLVRNMNPKVPAASQVPIIQRLSLVHSFLGNATTKPSPNRNTLKKFVGKVFADIRSVGAASVCSFQQVVLLIKATSALKECEGDVLNFLLSFLDSKRQYVHEHGSYLTWLFSSEVILPSIASPVNQGYLRELLSYSLSYLENNMHVRDLKFEIAIMFMLLSSFLSSRSGIFHVEDQGAIKTVLKLLNDLALPSQHNSIKSCALCMKCQVITALCGTVHPAKNDSTMTAWLQSLIFPEVESLKEHFSHLDLVAGSDVVLKKKLQVEIISTLASTCIALTVLSYQGVLADSQTRIQCSATARKIISLANFLSLKDDEKCFSDAELKATFYQVFFNAILSDTIESPLRKILSTSLLGSGLVVTWLECLLPPRIPSEFFQSLAQVVRKIEEDQTVTNSAVIDIFSTIRSIIETPSLPKFKSLWKFCHWVCDAAVKTKGTAYVEFLREITTSLRRADSFFQLDSAKSTRRDNDHCKVNTLLLHVLLPALTIVAQMQQQSSKLAEAFKMRLGSSVKNKDKEAVAAMVPYCIQWIASAYKSDRLIWLMILSCICHGDTEMVSLTRSLLAIGIVLPYGRPLSFFNHSKLIPTKLSTVISKKCAALTPLEHPSPLAFECDLRTRSFRKFVLSDEAWLSETLNDLVSPRLQLTLNIAALLSSAGAPSDDFNIFLDQDEIRCTTYCTAILAAQMLRIVWGESPSAFQISDVSISMSLLHLSMETILTSKAHLHDDLGVQFDKFVEILKSFLLLVVDSLVGCASLEQQPPESSFSSCTQLFKMTYSITDCALITHLSNSLKIFLDRVNKKQIHRAVVKDKVPVGLNSLKELLLNY